MFYAAKSDIDRPIATKKRPTNMSKRSSLSGKAIIALLQPETPLEKALLETPEFRLGLDWGEPRFGHPEGKVAVHVREVLDNIERLPQLTNAERKRLRLVALAHDTFKYLEDRSNPRDWSKHHGAIAKEFMKDYTSDQIVLDIIGAHDDAYYAWLYERRNVEHLKHKNLANLLLRMDHCLQLYYMFFKCDSLTGDKTLAPVLWFEENAMGIRVAPLQRV